MRFHLILRALLQILLKILLIVLDNVKNVVCQHLPTCEQAISSKPEAFVDLPSTLLGYCCYTCTLHACTVLLLKLMKWSSQGKYLCGNQDVIRIFIMLHTGGIDFGQYQLMSHLNLTVEQMTLSVLTLRFILMEFWRAVKRLSL